MNFINHDKEVIFFSVKHTGNRKISSIISLALCTFDGRYFYAELNDYDKRQVNNHIQNNIISKLRYSDIDKSFITISQKNQQSEIYASTMGDVNMHSCIEMKGTYKEVSKELVSWLSLVVNDKANTLLYGYKCPYEFILLQDIVLRSIGNKYLDTANSILPDFYIDILDYMLINEYESVDISNINNLSLHRYLKSLLKKKHIDNCYHPGRLSLYTLQGKTGEALHDVLFLRGLLYTINDESK